jgi:hypothetical protein
MSVRTLKDLKEATNLSFAKIARMMPPNGTITEESLGNKIKAYCNGKKIGGFEEYAVGLATVFSVSKETVLDAYKETEFQKQTEGLPVHGVNVLRSITALKNVGLPFSIFKTQQSNIAIVEAISADAQKKSPEFLSNSIKELIEASDHLNQLDEVQKFTLLVAAYKLKAINQGYLCAERFSYVKDAPSALSARILINLSQKEPLEVTVTLVMQLTDKGILRADIKTENTREIAVTPVARDWEIVRQIADSINREETYVAEPCPGRVRPDNGQEMKQFLAFCSKLDGRLSPIAALENGHVMFAAREISSEAVRILKREDCLPGLGAVVLSNGSGMEHLYSDNNNLTGFVATFLEMIETRRREIKSNRKQPEKDRKDQQMSESNNNYYSTFNGPTYLGSIGTNAQGQFNFATLDEDLLKLRSMIEDAKVEGHPAVTALKEAEKETEPKSKIEKVSAAINQAAKAVDTGSKAWGLVEKLQNALPSMVAANQ